MSDPVTVSVEIGLLKEVKEALRVCAEDLQCELDARYPEELRGRYPSYQRRYTNDRESVVNALYCLDNLPKLEGESK